MGELNKKNCYVLKQIFNEYNLNLYEGDTLNIDVKEVFNKDNFGNDKFNIQNNIKNMS